MAVRASSLTLSLLLLLKKKHQLYLHLPLSILLKYLFNPFKTSHPNPNHSLILTLIQTSLTSSEDLNQNPNSQLLFPLYQFNPSLWYSRSQALAATVRKMTSTISSTSLQQPITTPVPKQLLQLNKRSPNKRRKRSTSFSVFDLQLVYA